ncbi:hypothetical protein Cs7R123_04080 [Catellatospora sp. TT07R-123]|uniref:CBM96 family carbohydrate-binding protein n=1 Tax=Catellatospora sp. TT07R-123 TaxID=2733863 RepID=UPI001B12B2CE|nr:DNRLRE domain-containing protein [Catellatospora sp. TT07R-123]GHJ43066.1 hypothetical protein Cs7R123_04080 [Catellatospora sp. TT07R-123]
MAVANPGRAWRVPRARDPHVTSTFRRRLPVRACAAALLATTLITVPGSPAYAATYDTTLVSRADGTSGAAADGDSYGLAVSANGRYVVFASDADNLSDQDDNAYTNVFVRDLTTGTTTLVSRADGPTGAAANGPSADPAISADGRYVAFSSTAANLSSQDNDTCLVAGGLEQGPCADIFVRDLTAGTTTYVSRADGVDGDAPDGGSVTPSISDDGARVAFTSVAANLSTVAPHECYLEDTAFYYCPNFFVRDLRTGTTKFLSTGGTPYSTELPCRVQLSGDGRFAAFDGGVGGGSGWFDIVRYDLQTGTGEYANRVDGSGGGLALNGDSRCPSISADGRYVAFSSEATNLSADNVDGVSGVYVRDLRDSRTVFVSRADGANGAAAALASTEASISADGRYVAFTSRALNLSPSDVDTCYDPLQGADRPCPDVFVRDLQSQLTALVSRATGASGPGGDDRSTNPSISGDGKLVAFGSVADNLSTEDDDNVRDVFVRDWGAGLPPPPTIDLSVTASAAPATVPVGGNVTFTVRVANAGPAPATGVAVTDRLPSGVTFVSANAGQGGYTAASGVWSVGGLGSGAAATLQLVGKVTTTGQKANTAQVSAADQPDADSTPANSDAAEDDQATATVNGTAACPATATRTADADTWITSSWPTTNYGKDTILKVRSKANADARSLVHFPLPTLPAGCKVTTAKLRIYLSTAVSTRTVRATRLAGSWTETGVTWRTQPATTGNPATATVRAGWVEWTVTPQVADLYAAGNTGLQIRDAGEGAAGFEQRLHSRENTNKPTLTVSFGPG